MSLFKWKSKDRPQPSSHPEQGLRVETISLEGSPERIAQDLIRSSLPKTFLDEIDISTDEGLSRLLACLILRKDQASLEKDELVRFFQRNERSLRQGRLDVLQAFVAASPNVEGGEELSRFLEYFMEQIGHLLNRMPEKVNVKSDRLLWLCYALASKIKDGGFTFAQACQTLRKDEHRNCISSLSLVFMLRDFAEAIDTQNALGTEYLMMIGECALLSNDSQSLAATFGVLSHYPPIRDGTAWAEFITRCATQLEQANVLRPEDRAFLNKVSARYDAKVNDDDF